ncbi:hypothetical protein CENDO_08370 [Corynebacterium endometrii]|uniref:DUF218 domain-containing protein n=1 Tax=Corynebacterium endometrii TaxID=2488819 RepID=A0A4P7QJ40_9CORY|nr:hypothetical protein CENDO_08370 [Corynebacterium endometrii]
MKLLPSPRVTSSFLCTQQPKAIIVLGAAQYDGRASRVLAARLDHARILAARHPSALIITVGGRLPGDRFTEAEVSREYLLDAPPLDSSQPGAGVSFVPVGPGRVRAVSLGNDTAESLAAVAHEFPELSSGHGGTGQSRRRRRGSRTPARVTIVTDPLHVPRTYLLARKAGLNARVSPTRTCPQRFPQAAWWRYLAHEAGGLLVLAVETATSPAVARRLRSLLYRAAITEPKNSSTQEPINPN